ncbi:putative phospholipid-transporting ATPase IIB [Frankliniella fusca]|uniref:Phospholipid-transporting ATPase IIB n=1 Tax=Frankliniella fusca TaxID=407009 RepID=A0AAE1GSC5_9NEOP|nr:putative phospholipid-transporting ATPase IIB [Frankliniella fusca]
MAASTDSSNVNGSSNSDSASSPPPPPVPPEKIKEEVNEEVGNGVGEAHPKAIKREAENGVNTENGEPPAKIKRESKYVFLSPSL